MCSKNLLGKINAYMALHQRLGSEGNGDFPTIASQLGAEPKLDFPLEKSSGPANEPIEIYVIPDDRKEEALKKLYPEGAAGARFKIGGLRALLYYCNRHGLFRVSPRG